MSVSMENLLPQVRCKECGKVTGALFDRYVDLVNNKGLTAEEAFEVLKLRRYCCRKTINNPIVLPDDPMRANEFDLELAAATNAPPIQTVPGPRTYHLSGVSAGKKRIVLNS